MLKIPPVGCDDNIIRGVNLGGIDAVGTSKLPIHSSSLQALLTVVSWKPQLGVGSDHGFYNPAL